MHKHKVCKTCKGELVKKATKRTASQLKKPYYYTAYYYCPTCNKLYHDDKFKVVNTSLFGDGVQTSQKQTVVPVRQSASRIVYDIEIWTDGACVHNGTPKARATWAFVSEETERVGLVDGKQTNNVGEALAIYHALSWAGEQGYKKIKLHTDSQISLFGLKKPPHLVKANQEIFIAIAQIIAKYQLTVQYVKVLGHSGDRNNDRVDRLANDLARKGK
jgi:ribonuclease HI